MALARVALGSAYAEAGRDAEALHELETALLLEPSSAAAHSALGRAYGLQNRFKEGIQAYENGIEHEPDDPVLRDRLGSLYHRLARWDDAEGQFLKSIELDTSSWASGTDEAGETSAKIRASL